MPGNNRMKRSRGRMIKVKGPKSGHQKCPSPPVETVAPVPVGPFEQKPEDSVEAPQRCTPKQNADKPSLQEVETDRHAGKPNDGRDVPDVHAEATERLNAPKEFNLLSSQTSNGAKEIRQPSESHTRDSCNNTGAANSTVDRGIAVGQNTGNIHQNHGPTYHTNIHLFRRRDLTDEITEQMTKVLKDGNINQQVPISKEVHPKKPEPSEQSGSEHRIIESILQTPYGKQIQKDLKHEGNSAYVFVVDLRKVKRRWRMETSHTIEMTVDIAKLKNTKERVHDIFEFLRKLSFKESKLKEMETEAQCDMQQFSSLTKFDEISINLTDVADDIKLLTKQSVDKIVFLAELSPDKLLRLISDQVSGIYTSCIFAKVEVSEDSEKS